MKHKLDLTDGGDIDIETFEVDIGKTAKRTEKAIKSMERIKQRAETK